MERILLVDFVIEENTAEMINFMLENDGKIASDPDADILLTVQVICLNGASGTAVDKTIMFFLNGKAAFTLAQEGLLHTGRNNLWIGQHEFPLDLIAIFVNIRHNHRC